VLDRPDGTFLSPDFMCQRPNGLWEILELKIPATRVLRATNRRETFYKEFDTYVSQCQQDYSRHFNEGASRDAFETRYGSPVQESPDSLLIAGRAGEEIEREVHRMLAGRTPSVRHLTYDALVGLFEQAHAHRYGRWEGVPGVSVHILFVPHKPGICIFEAGELPDRDNFGLLLNEHGDLVFRVVDAKGVERLEVVSNDNAAITIGNLNYAACEVAFGRAALLTVRVNGAWFAESQVNRLSLSGLGTGRVGGVRVVLGSNLARTATTDMLVVEHLLLERTLSRPDRRNLDGYFAGKFGKYLESGAEGSPAGVLFTGNQHMVADLSMPRGERHFLQGDLALRPTYKVATGS